MFAFVACLFSIVVRPATSSEQSVPGFEPVCVAVSNGAEILEPPATLDAPEFDEPANASSSGNDPTTHDQASNSENSSPEPHVVEAPAPPRRGSKQPLLNRLSPEQRAKVFFALNTVIVLGAVMILVAWLGARATRAYMRHESRRAAPSPRRRGIDEDDWVKKPLVPRVDTDPDQDLS